MPFMGLTGLEHPRWLTHMVVNGVNYFLPHCIVILRFGGLGPNPGSIGGPVTLASDCFRPNQLVPIGYSD